MESICEHTESGRMEFNIKKGVLLVLIGKNLWFYIVILISTYVEYSNFGYHYSPFNPFLPKLCPQIPQNLYFFHQNISLRFKQYGFQILEIETCMSIYGETLMSHKNNITNILALVSKKERSNSVFNFFITTINVTTSTGSCFGSTDKSCLFDI